MSATQQSQPLEDIELDLLLEGIFRRYGFDFDGSFNESHVILCRNVMIYFKRELQAHVYNLLHESLDMFGVIGLGAGATMKSSPHEYAFEELDQTARLYRRIA